MKKVFFFILFSIMLFLVLSGCTDTDTTNNSTDTTDLQEQTAVTEETVLANELYILRYPSSGWGGISVKKLKESDFVLRIINALENLNETDKTAEKLSDEPFNPNRLPDNCPAEVNTLWIETKGKLYRITNDYSQICRVDTHFGEGVILEMTDELKKDLINAWQYAPYNTFIATVKRGDENVEIKNVFSAESTVEITVKEIKLDNSYENQNNSITLEITSSVNQTLEIDFASQQSDDNFGTMDSKSVTLSKDTPEEVTFDFWGWRDVTYGVNVSVENTRVRLIINP